MEKRVRFVTDLQGRPVIGATIRVTDYPGGALSTIYSDNGVTEKANPMTSVAPDGRYEYYAANGRYTEAITTNRGTSTINDILFDEALTTNQQFVVATGTGNAMVVAAFASGYTLADGDEIRVRVPGANTSPAPTIQLPSIGTLTIVRYGGRRLSAGDIKGAGHEISLRYRASPARMELVSPDESIVNVAHHGAVGDDSTDDTAAITAALAALATTGGVLECEPGKTYRCLTRLQIPVTAPNLVIDLKGATIKPINDFCFVNANLAATASTTVASGATLGSREVVVASATGLVVGHWARIWADNSGGGLEQELTYPSHWAKITEIVGTTIRLDRVLPLTYNGTVNFASYAALYGSITIKNGKIDGSENTFNGGTGQAMRLNSYECIRLEDLDFIGFDNADTSTNAVELFIGLEAYITRCRSQGGVSQSNMWDCQDIQHVCVSDCEINGDHFGMNIVRAVYARFADSTIVGRRKQNADDSVSPVRSVRGIKFYGCSHAQAVGNHLVDVESPVKVECCDRFLIADNYVLNAGLATYTGQCALNVGSQIGFTRMGEGTITGNVVENSGGIAINVSGDSKGRVVISNNVVRKCVKHAINSTAPDLVITGNQFIDFGTAGAAADYGINLSHATGRHVIDANIFSNDVDTDPICMNITSPNAVIGQNNVVTTNNKLTTQFAGGAAFHGVVSAAAFLTANTANDKTGDGTSYEVVCDGETFDNGGCYSTSTGRCTALLPGTYTVSGAAGLVNLGAGHTQGYVDILHYSAAGVLQSQRPFGRINAGAVRDANNATAINFGGTFRMAAGDHLRFVAIVANGTKTIGLLGNLTADLVQWTNINFSRVGP